MKAGEFHEDFCSAIHCLSYAITAIALQIKYEDVPIQREDVTRVLRDVNSAKHILDSIRRKVEQGDEG